MQMSNKYGPSAENVVNNKILKLLKLKSIEPEVFNEVELSIKNHVESISKKPKKVKNNFVSTLNSNSNRKRSKQTINNTDQTHEKSENRILRDQMVSHNKSHDMIQPSQRYENSK